MCRVQFWGTEVSEHCVGQTTGQTLVTWGSPLRLLPELLSMTCLQLSLKHDLKTGTLSWAHGALTPSILVDGVSATTFKTSSSNIGTRRVLLRPKSCLLTPKNQPLSVAETFLVLRLRHPANFLRYDVHKKPVLIIVYHMVLLLLLVHWRKRSSKQIWSLTAG